MISPDKIQLSAKVALGYFHPASLRFKLCTIVLDEAKVIQRIQVSENTVLTQTEPAFE